MKENFRFGLITTVVVGIKSPLSPQMRIDRWMFWNGQSTGFYCLPEQTVLLRLIALKVARYVVDFLLKILVN